MEGEGDKSLNQFVSDADTNSVSFHVTVASHTQTNNSSAQQVFFFYIILKGFKVEADKLHSLNSSVNRKKLNVLNSQVYSEKYSKEMCKYMNSNILLQCVILCRVY